MLNFIAQWRLQREAVRELSRLSDRELADLGIARVDIKNVARSAATMSRDEVAAAVAPVTALRAYDRDAAMAPSWAAHNRRSVAA